jgi:hypothetical protein
LRLEAIDSTGFTRSVRTPSNWTLKEKILKKIFLVPFAWGMQDDPGPRHGVLFKTPRTQCHRLTLKGQAVITSAVRLRNADLQKLVA